MTASRLALIVQPEESLGHLEDRLLRLEGWSVYRVDGLVPALRRLESLTFDLVCCEYASAAGLDAPAVRSVLAHSSGCPFVVTSLRSDGVRLARSLGVPFLRQPAAVAGLGAIVGPALAAA